MAILTFSILTHGSPGWCTMPVANLTDAAQPAPSEGRTCTVPAGLSEECTRALTADCHWISQCNGDSTCMAHRPRADISACDEVAQSKPQRMTFDGDIKKAERTTSNEPTGSERPKSASNVSKATSAPTSISRTTRAETFDGDPSVDVRACSRSLLSAQSACNLNQANTFRDQVSGGQDGDMYTASAGLQNINNIVLNCSYSQRICESTCGSALSNWQDQCSNNCSSSIRSAIDQLQEGASACMTLSNNVQYLTNAANNSMNTAALQTSNQDSMNSLSGNGYDSQRQNLPAAYSGGLNGSVHAMNFTANDELSKGTGEFEAIRERRGDFNVADHASISANQESEFFNRDLASNSPKVSVSVIPNGGGSAFGSIDSNTNSARLPSRSGASGQNQSGESITDIDRGYLSGQFSQNYNKDADLNRANFSIPSIKSSPKKAWWQGFSLVPYLNKWIGGVEPLRKVAVALGILSKDKKGHSQPKLLGRDGELYMEPLPPPQPMKSNQLLYGGIALIFLSVCWLIWIWRKQDLEGKAAKKASDRRLADRRLTNSNRRSQSIFVEPHLERRKDSKQDRRTHGRRIAERRQSDLNNPYPREEAVIAVISEKQERRGQRLSPENVAWKATRAIGKKKVFGF
jgi:hypothetical protein